MSSLQAEWSLEHTKTLKPAGAAEHRDLQGMELERWAGAGIPGGPMEGGHRRAGVHGRACH